MHRRRPSSFHLRGHATLLAGAALLLAAPASALQDETSPARRLVVEPASLELTVGDEVRLEARVLGPADEVLDEPVFFYSRERKSVSVDADGRVEALAPGEFSIVVRTRRPVSEVEGGDVESEVRLDTTVPVVVRALPVARLGLTATPGTPYVGTTIEWPAVAYDTRDEVLPDAEVTVESSAPEIASFDAFGRLRVHRPGAFHVILRAEGLSLEFPQLARENPVATLTVEPDGKTARTGDVVRFRVTARDAAGTEVTGVPIELSAGGRPEDDLGPGASAQVAADGRFVAETPGLYSVQATCGRVGASATVRIEPRRVAGHFELVGRGVVNDVHTSDLWVWKGVDGRDYAVTGTWGGNGEAIFWDVTDPEHIERISTVTVDARTVNDVKVSADGRLCILSREGASDRKNGVVLVDVTDPREPKVLASHDENLTGGVHNVYVEGDRLYALSAGRRYDIIDIKNPIEPRTIGGFELDTPGHSIHDVWVVDGLAYSSNWGDGVQIVDVGNGMRGGTSESPVRVARYAYPSGWNHAAFPFRNEATETFYVVAGDEAFPYGLHLTDTPTYPRGWLHFIDFTDLDAPREVARYQVPEAGTHNLWIEGDVCYAAFYNGGLRAVDVSGELMGDLYRQGREIAWYLPTDPEGYIPNAPMVWGPQPYEGNVFFSDWNTGLWCVRLVHDGKESDR